MPHEQPYRHQGGRYQHRPAFTLPIPGQAVITTACSGCGRAFPYYRELLSLPTGRQFVYEKASGRVWLVCQHCQTWNLLGTEAASVALPELELRLRSGLVQDFEGMTLSQVGSELEIIELKQAPTEQTLLTDPFAMARRDDLVAEQRQRQLNSRLSRARLLALAILGCVILMYGSEVISAVDTGIGALVTILGAAAIAGWLGWVAQPSGSRRLRGLFLTGDRFTGLLSVTPLYNRLVTIWVLVLLATEGSSLLPQSLGQLAFYLWFLALGIVAVTAVGPSSRRRRWWFPVACAALGLLTGWLWLLFGATMGWFLLAMATSGGLAAVGASAWWRRRRRRQLIEVQAPSGNTVEVQLGPVALAQVSLKFDSAQQQLLLRGLAQVGELSGSEARRLLLSLLEQHFSQGSNLDPTQTAAAVQLIRGLPDLASLLEVLSASSADQDGWIWLASLPSVYLHVLDMLLRREEKTPRLVIEHEIQAGGAREVADLAEQLDRELAEIPRSAVNE